MVYFLLRDEEAEGRLREVEGGSERLRELEEVEGIEELSLPAEDREVEGILQMGVSVGKRHFKRAVDRNLLKRRIREAYRKQKHDVKETLTALGISMDIFFVYSNARISDYAEIETAMTNGLLLLKDKISAK